MSLERVTRCTLCGSDNSNVVIRTKDFQYDGVEEFDYHRCAGCGIVFLSPRPDAHTLCSYYPQKKYYTHRLSEEDASLRGRIRHSVISQEYGYTGQGVEDKLPPVIRKLIFHLFRNSIIMPSPVDGGRLLDVGCGNGYWMRIFTEFGWVCEGVDTDDNCVDICKQQGMVTRLGDIFDPCLAEGEYDCLLMLNVLEHTTDPVAVTRRAHSLLKPGGQLVVTVPNYGGFESRIFKRHWRGIEAPRHMFQFTDETLTRILSEAGFAIRRKQFNSWFVSQWRESINYLVRDSFRDLKRTKRGVLNAFASFLNLSATAMFLLSKPIVYMYCRCTRCNAHVSNFMTFYSYKINSSTHAANRIE